MSEQTRIVKMRVGQYRHAVRYCGNDCREMYSTVECFFEHACSVGVWYLFLVQ